MTAHDHDGQILIVDDKPANLLALEAVLAPLGKPVVRASSGEQAIALANAGDFAVALMDVQMPVLDGFQTVERLRLSERTRELPVIFITAIHDDFAYASRGYQLGAVDYMAKPFEPDVLRAKVGALVALHLHQHELRARQAAELANRAKDEFLAIVSHELRTPLAAIVGWAEQLQHSDNTATQQRAVDAILRCARAQSQVVEDLLDVSRIVSGGLAIERQSVDVVEVLRAAVEAIAPIAQEKRIAVEVSARDAAAEVLGDPMRLQQVLWILLSNAVKFSRAGGRVDATLAVRDGSVELMVRDQGIGIAAEFLPFVFDRFRQAHADSSRRGSGLGLGLTIARHIVERHGGTIAAQSDGAGSGARFTVRLSLASL
jgi:signal transduction histidine kinase